MIEGKGYCKKYKLIVETLDLLYEGEYLNGEKNGKGKEYEDNHLIFEGDYLKGKRNGKGKEYYYNKKIMFNGEYKDGKQWNGKGYDPEEKEIYEIKNGKGYVKLFTKYDRSYCYFEGELKDGIENGKGIEYWKGKCTPTYKIFEGIYKNGERIEGRLYHLNKLEYEGTFLNGKKWNGINKILEHGYPPKSERFEGQYLNGKKWKGIQQNYEGYNNKISEFEYDNGKIWNVRGYNNKTKELAFEVKEGNGVMKYFEENQNGVYFVSFEIQVIDGEIKGRGKKYNYYDNAQIEFEGEYLNGKINGKGKEYYSNGKLLFEGEYYNNYMNGKGKKYYNNGNLMFEGEFLHSNKINGYFYNFKSEKETEIINGAGKVKEYDVYNGKLTFEGNYKNGLRWNGIIKEYNEQGIIIFEGVYINGEKEGNKIYYYDNGNIKSIHNYKNWGIVKEYYDDGKIKLEGNIFDGIVKEYHKNGKIKFEG